MLIKGIDFHSPLENRYCLDVMTINSGEMRHEVLRCVSSLAPHDWETAQPLANGKVGILSIQS